MLTDRRRKSVTVTNRYFSLRIALEKDVGLVLFDRSEREVKVDCFMIRCFYYIFSELNCVVPHVTNVVP